MILDITRTKSDILRNLACRLLQRLGLHKPHTRSLTVKDELWLFNNTAFRSAGDPNVWKAEFIGCYFRFDSGDKVAAVAADIIEKLGMIHGEEVENRVKERVAWFLNLIQPGTTVQIQFDGGKGVVAKEVEMNLQKLSIASAFSLRKPQSWQPQEDSQVPAEGRYSLTLGPAAGNGISSDTIAILPHREGQKAYSDGSIAYSAALLPKGYGTLNGLETMRTIFGEPTGWGVVSDIDDTIKVTEVLNRTEILQHTFALPSIPVPGMSNWYHSIVSALSNPIWFYLSASPYNLYPLLSSFLTDAKYPDGTIILRDMSWQELETFIYISLTEGVKEYKVDKMEKIRSWFPKRKMIFIGDSTQKDPESYGEIYRRHGRDWVKGIFIRVVKGVDETKEKELNKKERFEKAFEGVPGEGDEKVWWLFEEPEEMEGIVKRLVEKEENKKT